MIPISMSRKEPSFRQLISYMANENTHRRFDLYHNCFSRDQEKLGSEFLLNSTELSKRKNGNFLYHEIVSITLEEGVDREHAKACLREIAMKYIEQRCPENMVYGCLHEDHEKHLHYHLMISANKVGESRRLRLTTSQFRQLRIEFEHHVLETYPELKQTAIATKDEPKLAKRQKRAGSKKEKQEEVRNILLEAMGEASCLEEFENLLGKSGFAYNKRGKNYRVEVYEEGLKTDTHRFSTLGIAEQFEVFLS